MLELDGPMSPSYPRHQRSAVIGLYIRTARKLRLQHLEVVGDDRVKFVTLPGYAEFRFVGQNRPSSLRRARRESSVKHRYQFVPELATLGRERRPAELLVDGLHVRHCPIK